jgi:hypothetical protein
LIARGNCGGEKHCYKDFRAAVITEPSQNYVLWGLVLAMRSSSAETVSIESQSNMKPGENPFKLQIFFIPTIRLLFNYEALVVIVSGMEIEISEILPTYDTQGLPQAPQFPYIRNNINRTRWSSNVTIISMFSGPYS